MPRARASNTPPVATPATAPAPVDFEQAMAELESVVARLEQGDVPLEEALKAFERGVALTRACQEALQAAEQKVEILLARPDGTAVAAPFADAADPEEPA
ncbi:MAG TPA: exodeoxyribonuclease VII small subunit [Steroidobacteraceae bacterium]|nr:exodeoxyribonuclease VII small subunit [Steroidobacteraceae bacterium]